MAPDKKMAVEAVDSLGAQSSGMHAEEQAVPSSGVSDSGLSSVSVASTVAKVEAVVACPATPISVKHGNAVDNAVTDPYTGMSPNARARPLTRSASVDSGRDRSRTGSGTRMWFKQPRLANKENEGNILAPLELSFSRREPIPISPG